MSYGTVKQTGKKDSGFNLLNYSFLKVDMQDHYIQLMEKGLLSPYTQCKIVVENQKSS